MLTVDADSATRQSTMKRLIREVERSQRSEAHARQQAADAIASWQHLSEETSSSIAEMEAALALERQNSSVRMRAAEMALQLARARYNVHNSLLVKSLREVEADVACAWRELEAVTNQTTNKLLETMRAEHAAEVAALRSGTQKQLQHAADAVHV